MAASLLRHKPLRAIEGNAYVFTCKFDTNSTSDPDGVSPDLDGYTVARSSAGVFTITFDGDQKPLELLFASAEVLGDVTLAAQVQSYTPSTGVLLVHHYSDDGTPAVADTDDKTIQVLAVFTRKDDGIG